MEAIWLLVGLAVGGVGGSWAMLLLERTRRQGAENAEIAALRAQLDAVESTAQTLAGARQELLAVVQQGAGAEMGRRGGELVESLKTHLEANRIQSGADEEARRQAVANLVEPMYRGLGQLNERLERIDHAREQTATELASRLHLVTSGQTEVARSAAALERALRQPHVRGRWGELSLRRLAEMSGMSDICDFVEQPRLEGDDRVLRPDMLVRLPQDRLVVVDAKTPLAPFMDAMEATDEAARVERLRAYAQGVRAHVRKLADKSYAARCPSSPDFVVMFMPGEHFLGGALEVDPDLLEDAFARDVHIATPVTVLALLRTVAYAFQQQKVAADAQAIGQLGRELYDRIVTLLAHIDKVSRCVDSLAKAQSEVVGSLESRVLSSARKFSELGVAGAQETLPEARRVTATGRRVQARELSAADGVHAVAPSSSAEEAA